MGQGLMNCDVTASDDVYLHELICMGGEGGESVGWRTHKEMEKINSSLFDPLAQPQVLTLEP